MGKLILSMIKVKFYKVLFVPWASVIFIHLL